MASEQHGSKKGSLETAVADVVEPEIGLSLHQLGMVRSVRERRKRASIVVALPLAQWPSEGELQRRVHQAALGFPGVEQVSVEFEVMDEAQRKGVRDRVRALMAGSASGEPGADGRSNGDGHSNGDEHAHGDQPTPAFLQAGSSTRVIGVSSGKGGVGKSSVTVNLGIALSNAGHDVAILDADVYGFSVPKMLGGVADPLILGDTVIPARAHGVRCLSMGYFVPEDQPVIWRGPMLHKAIEQFLSDAYWGQPDFLLVDMPPGTGDVALSMAQVMPRAEVIVVTTPQSAAQIVAQRSALAARKLKLSVRGVVENMSWFSGDDGKRYELFGRGGGDTLAADLGVPLLCRIPLIPQLREGGDIGVPVVVSDPEGEAGVAFSELANRLAALGPSRVYRRELTLR